jgi:chemotaxis protein CheY-P-specific phosphatase CheC
VEEEIWKDGTYLMLLEVHDALIIAGLTIGGDGTDVSGMQIDELTLSAISEVLNSFTASEDIDRHWFPTWK